jgi:hypothetical protein
MPSDTYAVETPEGEVVVRTSDELCAGCRSKSVGIFVPIEEEVPGWTLEGVMVCEKHRDSYNGLQERESITYVPIEAW